MKKPLVVFVTINEYDNLGIGYLSSVLSEAGYVVRIVDFNKKDNDILRIIKKLDPLLVGFSVVYQYHIGLFRDLIIYLRDNGIKCHFTSGGHYASLKPGELFKYIPALDSIIRFEGEYTIRELADSLNSGSDWHSIKSVSYIFNGRLINNPLRPLEKDLDKFPFPYRAPLRKIGFELKIATIAAGRGCIYNCSFCNARKFYSQPPGPLKRIRKPEMVVKEMAGLVKKKNCSVFFFIDDDFPLNPAPEPGWIEHFCDELRRNSLSDKIMWKICCRPDEVDEEVFKLMKNNGLYQVFLGIEDGTDNGLKRLNKQMSVEKCIEGIRILRKLRIEYDYGFMLFQPWMTYESLNKNLDFLRNITSNGYTPVSFLKLMPYYETRVEKELIMEGRLKLTSEGRDYSFNADSLNHFFEFITSCFREWLRHNDGVVNLSKWGRNYYSMYYRYFGRDPDVKRLNRNFKKILSDSNKYILESLQHLSAVFESGVWRDGNKGFLEEFRDKSKRRHRSFKKRFQNNLEELMDLPVKHFLSQM
jgi:anaerobic magnesium-protoporphyrin IX monomethyl ester cyclase